MVGHGGGSGGKSSAPYIIGSATSGVLEILIFHPIDTIAKRLMSNTTTIFQQGAERSENMARLSTVLFKENANKPIMTKFSLICIYINYICK